ncbi:MAG: hypothetical protein LBE18_00110, partial [Planctomycetaceae bacterium]|nr:hypothetical protein [Planctomycetaceae bacterium]
MSQLFFFNAEPHCSFENHALADTETKYITNYTISSAVSVKIVLLLITCAVSLLVIGCSCNTAKNSPTHGQTPKSNTDDSNSWTTAYNKGRELYDKGELTEASYYFSNALGTKPGNYTVIKAYYDTMMKISNNNGETDTDVLQIVEGFLQSQIPHTEYNNVEKIMIL